MAKRPLSPEELQVGTEVIYHGHLRGVVSDAFGPLDQFWIKDAKTGEKVRHTDGEVLAFSAAQLERVVSARPAKMPFAGQAGEQVDEGSKVSARVVIVGTEEQMCQIIQHFGPPDGANRREPQMLLAVPCTSCRCGPLCERYDVSKYATCDRVSCPLIQLAAAGIDNDMLQLAGNLRPDLANKMGIRAYQLKQAMEMLGPDLAKLEDYYCLAAVTLPFGWQAIESTAGARRRMMQEVRCQIDLGVTAEAEFVEGETDTLERTAMRALGEACGIRLSEAVWEEEVQYRMRKLLGVDMPLRYYDGPRTKGFALILPSDLVPFNEGGLLTFREPGSRAPVSLGDSQQIGGKSVADWKAEQGQFSHLPKLPDDWIRIKARNSADTYFWNTRTKTSTYEHPLPEGWTKQTSKSTGKVYYFNSKKKQSMYTIPTES